MRTFVKLKFGWTSLNFTMSGFARRIAVAAGFDFAAGSSWYFNPPRLLMTPNASTGDPGLPSNLLRFGAMVQDG